MRIPIFFVFCSWFIEAFFVEEYVQFLQKRLIICNARSQAFLCGFSQSYSHWANFGQNYQVKTMQWWLWKFLNEIDSHAADALICQALMIWDHRKSAHLLIEFLSNFLSLLLSATWREQADVKHSHAHTIDRKLSH